MNQNELIGRGEEAFGEIEQNIGKATGSTEAQVRGAAHRAKGGARVAAGKVQKAIDKTADRLTEGLTATTAKTHAAVDRACDSVQELKDRIDPFVTSRPYASLGIGVAAGVVLGLLLAGRPKVVYVKPPRP